MNQVWWRWVVVGLVGLAVAVGAWNSIAFEDGDAALGPVIFVVATFLVVKVPENRVSWTLMAIAFGLGLNGFFREGVGWSETLSFASFFAVVLPGMGIFLPAWFPTGYPPGNGWKWLSGLGYSAVGLLLASVAFGHVVGDFDDDIVGCVSPSACMEFVAVLLTLAGVLLAIVSLFFRFARSDGSERQQLKLIALAFGLFLIGAALQFGGLQGNPIADTAFALGSLAIPLALAVTISRYRLYDIDRIISRTVTYAIVVGLLAGVVALVATLISTQFESPLVVAATTLAVAALFSPLRKRVQRWVDRRFNRSRYDAERVMDQFAGSLRDATDAEEVVGGWVGVVSETMQPTLIGVWVRP